MVSQRELWLLLARHGGSVNRTIEPTARHGGMVNEDRTIEPRARHSGTVNRTIEPQQAALKEFDGFDDETVENKGSPTAQARQQGQPDNQRDRCACCTADYEQHVR